MGSVQDTPKTLRRETLDHFDSNFFALGDKNSLLVDIVTAKVD